MAKHRQTEKQFSLKDILFNKEKVRQLASEIKAIYPKFNQPSFENAVLKRFPKEELMERIRNIRDELRNYLPKEYEAALNIILKALPSELDHGKSDNDFGDFIYAPYSYFVATYGCNQKHVNISLKALREITKRFSAEGALRDFLNAFPKETLKVVDEWSKDKNYHVRRLSTEGTRPNLPWAKRVNVKPDTFLPVLDRLHSDKTRYVVRSVANHLNDLSKIDKKLTFKLLKKWLKEKSQSEKELSYIISHALRTLIRQGDKEAMKFIGLKSAEIKVSNFKLKDKTVPVGGTLEFSFHLSSRIKASQDLMIDYVVYFNKANGKLTPKTFKICKKKIGPLGTLTISKKHPFRLTSTRTLYLGKHELGLQINGRHYGKKRFYLQ